MTVLIVGLGSIAKKHIKAIKSLVADPVIYALRTSACADSYEDVINIFDLNALTISPDFVIISNPSSLHLQTIADLLPLKCPMMIEKPLSHGLQHITARIHDIQQTGVFTYVACNLRFHPVITFLKDYLGTDHPVINEVNIYCGSYLPDWRPGKDFRTIYSSEADMGGGIHLDAIHEIDYAYWLFGKPLSVNRLQRSVSSLNINAIDFAAYDLLYKGFTAGITLNYYRRDTRRTIELVFENTTWVADLLTCRITDHTGQVIFERSNYTIQTTYLEQMQYFLNSINSGEASMNNIEEAFEVLKICVADETGR